MLRIRTKIPVMKTPTSRDDDGKIVRAGDRIRFSYGIPSIVVVAEVIDRDGVLIALTPGHNPPECKLRMLRRYAVEWFRD